jgi:hypothetical protein
VENFLSNFEKIFVVTFMFALFLNVASLRGMLSATAANPKGRVFERENKHTHIIVVRYWRGCGLVQRVSICVH